MKRFIVCVLGWMCSVAAASEPIRVASKNFNESYILAEIMAQALEARGFEVERQFGLGGTLICFGALENGEIDVYPEYTGTLSQVVLKLSDPPNGESPQSQMAAALADRQLRILPAFGFNNTYALVVPQALARERDLARISDLRAHPDLRLVFSHEFLEREDGWPGLSALYELTHPVRGIEHALAYQALEENAIDLTDAYSTDGELERYRLVTLADDRRFFPEYLAAPLIRAELPAEAQRVLEALAGTIDDARMQALNSAVVFGGQTFAEVASQYLVAQGIRGADSADAGDTFWAELGGNVVRHLQLTAVALVSAVLIGIALALMIYRREAMSRGVLYVCSLLQTIPSIALLALMIPLFGIGFLPAVVALFLYSLLPVLRNAVMGLTSVDPVLVRVATSMGLSEREQLRHLRLPLALPAVFAGVRTAAVISIGTATLAAFIGAGGLGDPIVTGLSLNDVGLILQGAVPAAGLAIATELLFEWLEARWVPGHLRQR